jgi:hypothetical protein
MTPPATRPDWCAASVLGESVEAGVGEGWAFERVTVLVLFEEEGKEEGEQGRVLFLGRVTRPEAGSREMVRVGWCSGEVPLGRKVEVAVAAYWVRVTVWVVVVVQASSAAAGACLDGGGGGSPGPGTKRGREMCIFDLPGLSGWLVGW